MPVSKKSSRKTSKKSTRRSNKKKAGSSFLANSMDPFNQFPNHETGEEEYGPIPPFGYNKHDVMNMKPFNPNVMNSMMGGAPLMQAPMYNPITYGPGAGSLLMPPPFNMLNVAGGFPNPAAPILQPMVPGVPSGVSPLGAPASYGMFPSMGYSGVSPQNYHPNDPNNQYPNPLNGSMAGPGPALEGGMNHYDPYNVIGAPVGTPAQNRETTRQMMNQPRHPRSPYILN